MEELVDFIWNPYLLLCFLAVGLYISLLSGFFQGNILFWWKETLGQKKDFSQISALFTALATTIGTGSIAGVATAIYLGGAGAVFWMWVSAFLGMILSACEKILTIHYRVQDKNTQSFVGGPMYYLHHGLHCPFLAKFFSLACLFSTLVGGNLVQSASIAQGLQHLFHIPTWLTGLTLTLLVTKTLRGGMALVAKISSILVPLMATIYLGSGLYCLSQNIPALFSAIESIFSSAWSSQAVVGGGGGYTVFTALRYGMARGIFSNEAGLGASAMAHSNANVDHPARQGLWGIVEVFFATMVVCTITALVLLTSGIFTQADSALTLGVPMTQSAFAMTMGQWGSGIVLFSLILFAYTSILGWACYGQIALNYLSPHRFARKCYSLMTVLCLFWGAMGNPEKVWHWVDLSIALMAVPNLIGLVFLAPQALSLLEEFQQKTKKSPFHQSRRGAINQPYPHFHRK